MAKKGGFLLGAVVGGTAAAIAALLLAPKSGKELRDELAAQADDLMDMASDYTDMAKEKSTELTGIA
ncbi:YtxH domain-containing protein, partial [Staphylococcus aureus]